MRAWLLLITIAAPLAAQDDVCAAPVRAATAAPTPDAAADAATPTLTTLRRTPLGEVTLADESLTALALYGVDMAVEQARRTADDAPATDVVPVLLTVDGAAGVRALRHLENGRRIPQVVASIALDGAADPLALEVTLTDAEVVSLRASHRAGLSRQHWALVPSSIAWRVVRGDEEPGQVARFDLLTGVGVVPPAEVASWTVTLDDDAPDRALRALAIEEDVDDAGAPRTTLWRRPDARTPALLAAAHAGTLVPTVTLDVAGPERRLEDVVVAAMRLELDRDGRPYEVVTLVAGNATWTSDVDGQATFVGR